MKSLIEEQACTYADILLTVQRLGGYTEARMRVSFQPFTLMGQIGFSLTQTSKLRAWIQKRGSFEGGTE